MRNALMIRKEKYESTISALYRRNERFLGISAILFLGSMFIGYFFSGILEFYLENMVESLRRAVIEGEIELNTLSIFSHNLRIALLIYGGGILLSVFTIILLVINGLFIGYFATTVPIGNFAILTLPHGIFEIPSIIVAGAAGFRVTSFVYRLFYDLVDTRFHGSTLDKMVYSFRENQPELEESLLLLGISIVLLFIAAVVEANLTLPWAQYVLRTI